MNFFQAQDAAKRKTWRLVAMFAAALVSLIVLTNLLFALLLGFGGSPGGVTQTLTQIPATQWGWISFAVVGVVALASLFRYLSLQSGGRTIAEALGGKLVQPNTQVPQQRRLLNVVEEIAIAAGTPVPPVYLIPESSINAFAAGFSIDDAVIGINQGTLDLLDRKELQGVVAHEFSHILNGDMHLNLRLIAVIYGILFIGIIGGGIARAGAFNRRNGGAMVALGLGLVVIGYGGTFFGNLIKAAVSRQREYLADASAVQFTRDPSGIADALKKIGGHSLGSTLALPAAEEASHMFFGAVAKKFSGHLLATHPPLPERIRAIEPTWDGHFMTTSAASSATQQERAEPPRRAVTQQPPAFTAAMANAALPAQWVAQVGTLSDDGVSNAQYLIEHQSESLRDAARDPFEARALIYAMLVQRDPETARLQWALLEAHAETGVPEHTRRLLAQVQATDPASRLALVSMAIPALKKLSQSQYQRFSQNTAHLITTDGTVELFEWVLHRVLTKELYAHFHGPQNHHGHIRRVGRVADEVAALLSIVANQGHDDSEVAQQAYLAGARALKLTQPFVREHQFDYQRLNAILGRLRKLKPLLKPTVLEACAITALHDQRISAAEGALLQGIAATLDCPMPASIYGQLSPAEETQTS